MKIYLLDFHTASEEWSERACSLYEKKIKALCDFEIKSIKPSKGTRADKESRLKDEGQAIERIILSNDYLIVFDEKGKTPDSLQFSKEIQKILSSGKQRAYFLIGGPFGVHADIKKRAQNIISLSSMTMNHLVAKTVALEQIYRALAIIKNLPYHNP